MSKPIETKTYRESWDLPQPPEKVWRALTESELLAKWIRSNDMQAIVGHRFTFRMEPSPWWDGIVHCEVLEVDSPHRLCYTWRGGPKNSQGKFGVDTVVTWTLKPTRTGGTVLSIEQSGFDPEAKQAYGGAKLGWERNVTMLGHLLAELSKGEKS